MKGTQHLKLRIERNGKVLHRYLRHKESLTVGRSPDNDVVVYSEGFPKKMKMFVPSSNGYDLHLLKNCRGEVLLNKSRLLFNDLITHDILPKENGYHKVPLTVGKAGYVHLEDVRIDFAFDGTRVEAMSFEGYSASRAFLRSLTDDLLFRSIITALLVISAGLINWARGLEFELPKNEVVATEAIKRIARFVPKVEEKPEPIANIGRPEEETTSADSKKDETKDKKLASTKEREGEKKGFGRKTENPGQGVNVEEVGILSLLGGTGISDNTSDVIDAMIDNDLAKSLDDVMTKRPLSAGGRSNSGEADLENLLAASEIGIGKGGGGATIDEILSGTIGAEKSVNLEKKGRVKIDRIGKVSGSEEAIGARSEASLYAVLKKNMGRLQYYYEKYLKSDPNIGGKLEVEVTINPNGSVAKVNILSNAIPIPAFEQDVVNAIRRWKYPSIPSGIVKVVYPIVFTRT